MQKVMVVDDDPLAAEEIGMLLSDENIEVMTANSGTDALMKFDKDRDVAVVITDLRMPDFDGLVLVDSLRNIAEVEKRLVQFVVMSGNSSMDDAIGAIQKGVCDYLQKPVDPSQILNTTKKALRRTAELKAADATREASRTTIRHLERRLDDIDSEIAGKLSVAAELKDPETGNHINRIGSYAELMSRLLGQPPSMQGIMYLAAPLHDIGKIGVPEAILQKPGSLTPEEVLEMQNHTRHGHRILSKSRSKTFSVAAEIALAHHERWDGSGYPQGLKGEEIPLSARITSLVDVYDALRSRRSYKPEYSHATVLEILRNGDGRTVPEHFDPHILSLFMKHNEEFDSIYELLRD